MKQLLFLFITAIFFTIHSFGQFADTAHLNAYIRDTIKDRRPDKVTSAQIQKALLGTTQFIGTVGSSGTINSTSIQTDTSIMTIGQTGVPYTGTGQTRANITITSSEYGGGGISMAAMANYGQPEPTSNLNLMYDGTINLSGTSYDPRIKIVGLSIQPFNSLITSRVDSMGGSDEMNFTQIVQGGGYFRFEQGRDADGVPLDFRLINLPATTDTAANKPLSVDANGNVKRLASWPSTETIVTVSSNTTVDGTRKTYIVNTSGGNVTLNVDPSTLGNLAFSVKKRGTDTNSVTINMTTGSIYADSGAQSSFTFNSAGGAVSVHLDGTNAYIL